MSAHGDGHRGRWLVIGILGVGAILAAFALYYRSSAWRSPPRPSMMPATERVQHPAE
jgi:hypothetical protein